MKKRPHSSAHSAQPGAALSRDDLRTGIEDFLLDGEVQGHSIQTLKNRRFLFTKLVEFLEAHGHTSCGWREITAFLAHIRQGHTRPDGRWGNGGASTPLRPRSYSTYFGHLQTLFKFLVSRDYIDISPMDKLKPPVCRSDQIQPFSPDQTQLLIRAARASRAPLRNEAILMVLLDCGLRASELCALRRCDVEMGERLIQVTGKGNKVRRVPFSAPTARALTTYINRERKERDDFLFTADRGRSANEPLTRSGLLQLIERLGQSAGICGVRCSPHTLRHTFAIEFLRGKGNVFSLMTMLGHESLDMTQRYVAIAEADLQAVHRAASPVSRLLNRVK